MCRNDDSKIKKEKLNTICNFVSGGTPDTKHPEYYGGDIPWISTVALGPNYIDKTSAKDFLTELGVNKSATHLIKKGTLLFGNRVGVGKTSITNCDMCTNQDILALTDIDETRINNLYLKIVLDMQREYFESQKRGATIKGIPIDILGNVFIPIPSLQIQNQFADFVQKSEESKLAIQASLDSLSAVYKKIIAENLGGK
ncbi:MAG: restriction endonuclease subunit S [Treponema sp.]|nr:restriction endonuclease subunit S [Treponema sp.]